MTTELLIPATGEVISLPSGTADEVLSSLKVADASYEAWRQMRNMLRDRAVDLLQRQQKTTNEGE